MNRSFSKIRHIQEANQRLENRLVENVIVEAEASQIPPGLLKSLVQGGKNLVDKMMGTKSTKSTPWVKFAPRTTDDMIQDLVASGVSGSTARLLAKLGTLKMSDVLTRVLSPVRDELVVALRDYKNVLSNLPQVPPNSNDVTSNAIYKFKWSGEDLERNLDRLQVPKGQPVDLADIYMGLIYARKSLGSANLLLKMDPTTMKLFQIYQKNLDDAIVKFDDAIADIIVR